MLRSLSPALPRRRLATAGVALAVLLGCAAVVPGGASVAADTSADTAAPCPSQKAHPWCDRHLSAARRAVLFQQAMTQDEEISLIGGNGTGASPHTGATYAVPRLGLRPIYFSDGPVGPRQGTATANPIPMALAATFSTALATANGRQIADEAKHKGNDVVYAPTVNIMRTPQGGRTYEAYGEETFLSASTGMHWIRGAQSTGVIADVKHYLANNQEGGNGLPPFAAADGGRMVVNANVDERTLREVYMPQFEAAVKQADVGTVMCSYNRVNGAYACENQHTLVQVLRKQWGFDGFTISDYGASKDTAGNLNNGLDFVPAQGEIDYSYTPVLIQAALASGLVTKATLDGHVRNIIRTLIRFGVFDRPAYRNDDHGVASAAHRALARRTEQRAITLLKNKGVLPLKPGVKKIAVIGPYADRFITGGGSGGVSPASVVTALKGITRRAGSHVTITYADGSDHTAAAALARAADVAVVVVGDVQTEGQDKDCLGLNCTSDLADSNAVLLSTGSSCAQQSCPLNGLDEDGLVTAVAGAQPKTVVVLQTGGPVLTPWRSQVPAIVEAWYPGQEGGTALAKVLFGDVDPGGRLPATFPANADQVPTAGHRDWYPGIAEEETYGEKLDVGYKWYDAHHLKPAFAFGSGLSYTRFRYGALHLVRSGDRLRAVGRVTNVGRRAGIAVPQLYVGKPSSATLPQPVRQLVGYKSFRLAPGASRRVSFPLNGRTFASWVHGGWHIPHGCARLTWGASSRSLGRPVTTGPGCRGADAPLPAGMRFFLPLP